MINSTLSSLPIIYLILPPSILRVTLKVSLKQNLVQFHYCKVHVLPKFSSCGVKSRFKIDMTRSPDNSPHKGILGAILVLVKDGEVRVDS